jgi:hypothetical protein
LQASGRNDLTAGSTDDLTASGRCSICPASKQVISATGGGELARCSFQRSGCGGASQFWFDLL